MNVEDLAAFATIADTLNLSRAAERLHTSQPRLSQQLARLERELGTTLFERMSRGLRLSPAGQTLLPYAADLTRIYTAALDALQSIRNQAHHQLRLGVVHTSSMSCVATILHALCASSPEIKVTVAWADLTTHVAAIQSGDLDACLCFEPPEYGRLSWIPMFTTRLVGLSAASADMPAMSPLSDFCRHPLALLSPRCNCRLALDRAFKRMGLHPSVQMEMDDANSLASVVKRGACVTILPECQTTPSRHLRYTRLVDPEITLVRGILHKPESNEAIQALLNACRQCPQCQSNGLMPHDNGRLAESAANHRIN